MNYPKMPSPSMATPQPKPAEPSHLVPKPTSGKKYGLSVQVAGNAQQPDPMRINAYLRYLNQGATPLASTEG